VAYLAVGEQAAGDEEIRRYLQGYLPGYMIPTGYVRLPELPLTPNGKVDRKALPAYECSRAAKIYLGPRTSVEEITAGIWASVLSLKEVSIDDNFFELGGHSLLATQVVSRLRTAFEVELPLRTIFEHSTVAGVAREIELARKTGLGLDAPPISPADRSSDLPLSYAQQRLWFIDQLRPGTSLYNTSQAVRLSGELNVTALNQSLDEIVRRHEILRTSFPSINGEPAQLIAARASLN
jgi:acyl carrier protein